MGEDREAERTWAERQTHALSSEERAEIRGNAEVGVLATLLSCIDDATTVVHHMSANDLPLDVIARSIGQAEEAAAILRCVRDEYDMSIRAEAHEAIARLG